MLITSSSHPRKEARGGGGGGGGFLGFQVMGMIEGFWGGLQFSIPRYFGVGKFGKYFFGWRNLSWDFLDITDLRWVVLRIKHNQRKCSWVFLVLFK